MSPAPVWSMPVLQSDLNLNSGSFNATLPFNVTLAETYNKTNDTLQIDPIASQLAGGSFATIRPGGSYTLDFILDSLAKVAISGLRHPCTGRCLSTRQFHSWIGTAPT